MLFLLLTVLLCSYGDFSSSCQRPLLTMYHVPLPDTPR